MDIKCADSDLGKQGRLDRHCTIVIRDPASKPSPPFVSPYHTIRSTCAESNTRPFVRLGWEGRGGEEEEATNLAQRESDGKVGGRSREDCLPA